MSLFPSIFCTISAFSLYGECVVRFSFRMVFFYLVTTGWIFDISLYYVRIQPINQNAECEESNQKLKIKYQFAPLFSYTPQSIILLVLQETRAMETGVCVCVFFPSILDIKFVGRTSRGHTGFFIHLLSAVRALIFLARRIQPFLSLVDREVEFCVLTI